MASPQATNVCELALAAAPAPLSVDDLVGWNLARPAELFGYLSAAQADGRLAQPEPGRFTLADAARRDAALARAGAAEWGALLGSPERVAWAIEAGRAAAAARRFAAASAIFRALVAAPGRDLFPGGARGWLEVVIEALRLFRAMEGIATEDLLAALAVAAELGHVGAQGVLHGAVDMILAARHVYTAGLGISYILADLLSYQLSQVGISSTPLRQGSTEFAEQVLYFQPNDLLIAFSFPPYSLETIDTARIAHDRANKVIAITNKANAPITFSATLSLLVKSENMLFTNSFAAISVLINALSTQCALKDKPRAEKMLNELSTLVQSTTIHM